MDIVSCNVFDLENHVQCGDLVYLDPPYHPVKRTSFTQYSQTGFGEQEQVELSGLFKRLGRKGVHVLMSNSDTAFVRGLYHDCEIETVYAIRSINRDSTKRGRVPELLIQYRA